MSTTEAGQAVVPFNLTFFSLTFNCEFFGTSVISKGLFQNDDPFRHTIPILMLVLGASILMTAILRRILLPLNQPRFVAEMLTGILLGPSILQHFLLGGEFYASLFNSRQQILMNLLESLCLPFYTYLVAVRTNVSIIKYSGKLVWVLGIANFAFPIALSYSLNRLLGTILSIDNNVLVNLCPLAASTTFHVTSILLDDLKLLNSEIGRLALSSALISSLCSCIFSAVNNFFIWTMFLKIEVKDQVMQFVTHNLVILFIIFVLRPLMFWLIRKVPEGKNIKESHFLFMTVMMLGTGFASESLGLSAAFGMMILGLAVPLGQPLGSGMTEKLSLLISKFLLPAYIINVGRFVNVHHIHMTKSQLGAVILIFGTFLGKLAATVIPLRLCKMPFRYALAFGLIVSSQGIFDVLFFKRSLSNQLLNEGLFSIITIMAVLYAAIVTPIIKHLYDPSKRYVNYKRRTIQHSKNEKELRILVCIHEEDDVINILNVLEASYPREKSPLGVYVLDLMELVGRDHPVLINHQFHTERSSSTLTRKDRIINAFHHFELQQHQGIKHQHFTAIAPYTLMHNDICTLALDKSASLLIIPFQKDSTAMMRGVTRNVLDKAPCSVGILVVKKIVTYWKNWSHSQDDDEEAKTFFNVCVIFLGGPDSREALTYGMRMVENPAIKLTVIRLIAAEEFLLDILETKLDVRMITELRDLYKDNERIEYREVMVKDGANTMEALRSLDDNFDLVLVGRRIDIESRLVVGLADWSCVPELGIIGDILASSDIKSNASLLVLQQQSTIEDLQSIQKS